MKLMHRMIVNRVKRARTENCQSNLGHHVDPRETRDFYLSVQRFNAQRDEEREFERMIYPNG